MRLLVVTQAVDRKDPVLGFFHRWLEELSRRFERVSVVCLYEGEHSLPDNVRVYSLGKEKGEATKLVYATRFWEHLWKLRGEYDAVFVHMNQEYVLLGAPFWKPAGTRVFLWRNHYAGGFFTKLAVRLCDKVFCTSAHSYTARFRKTVLMPVGIDTSIFKPVLGSSRTKGSILSLGRIAPSKRIEMLLDALEAAANANMEFSADIYGGALPEDVGYLERLKERAQRAPLSGKAALKGPVENDATPEVYSTHDIFVNTSRSGMYDKTLFEAAACGCRVLSASDDFAKLSGTEAFTDAETLTQQLTEALSHRPDGTIPGFVAEHSLSALGKKLSEEMTV